MAGAQKFKHIPAPRQPGELARLKVVSGPDVGAVFVLSAAQVSIGRGDENDIVLSDLKASRRHAQLTFNASANKWEVSDWGSANGILHNGRPTPKSAMKTTDLVTVGETTLEFVGAEAGTAQLQAPASSALRLAGGIPVAVGRGATGPGDRRAPKLILIVGAVVAVFAVVFLDESPKGSQDGGRKQVKVAPPPVMRDLASYLPKPDGQHGSSNKTAENFFRAGFREYRERNYIRARSQFETALQLEPSHHLAKMYLENCKREIDEEIKFHLEQGKKSQESGKLKKARSHYQAIQRLLFRTPKDPAFVEAGAQIDKVQKEISGDASGGSG